MKLTKGRVPLERALSKLGLCSRAEAVLLIQSGQVKVHGVIETNAQRMVNPDTAHIEMNGIKAHRLETVILLFHKPTGVVTTKRDPEGRRTIFDILPIEYQSFHAIGRLDMYTSGLLLLTNDTQLSNFMTDPENAVERVYRVTLNGKLAVDMVAKLIAGVDDKGEHLKADQVKILKQSGKGNLLELILIAGKNREIRRLCLALGHEVQTLKRIRYGDHELLDLKSGEYRIALNETG